MKSIKLGKNRLIQSVRTFSVTYQRTIFLYYFLPEHFKRKRQVLIVETSLVRLFFLHSGIQVFLHITLKFLFPRCHDLSSHKVSIWLQKLEQALLFTETCSFVTVLFIVWNNRKSRTFLSNKMTKYFKIPICFHFTYLFENGKKMRWEVNEEIALHL